MNYFAVDLGATSGRTILASFDGSKVFMSGCFNVGQEFGKGLNFGELTDPMFRTLPATLHVHTTGR